MTDLAEFIKVEVATFGPCKQDSDEYKELRETLKDRRRFRVWDLSKNKGVKAGVYHVERKFLFGNQANTKEGFRIFDFADYSTHPDTKRTRYGHYIVNIDELDAARSIRCACGYCGNQIDNAAGEWCEKCRSSEYLEVSNYPLLQMLPVSGKRNHVAMTPPAEVIADIEAKQKAATIKRVAAKVETRKLDLAQKVLDSEYEAEFITLCAERGLANKIIENMIYYTHTNKLTFGWPNPLAVAERDVIRETLEDVWHLYDVAFKMES